ncbi:MAG: tetratricopeptide repeat protein, partial [Steroidobacteraceae bacterium]
IQAHPEDATLSRARLSDLGNGLLQRGDTAAAVALLDIVAEMYPTSSLARYSLAEAQIAQDDHGNAVANLREALTLVDSDPEVADFRKAARYTASRRLRSLAGAEGATRNE